MGLDRVELVMCWEDAFGISISNADAATIRTPRIAMDVIASQLGARESSGIDCLSMRAFYRLRESLITMVGVRRRDVRPRARLRDLVVKKRRRTWDAVRAGAGMGALPSPDWFSRHTMADLSRWAVAHHPRALKRPGDPWTRRQVRDVVRAGITEQLAIEEFHDDDDFVRDLRVD